MKNMQDFHNWLSSENGTPTLDQRCLSALTRVNRAQLSKATSDSTWFLWEAKESVSLS